MQAESKVADETTTKAPEMPRSEAALPVPVEKPRVPELRDGLLAAQLSPETIELLRRTVAKGATDDEIAVFVHVCNRTQLDPLTKQIHAIKRRVKNEDTDTWGEVTAFQIGIDGFRLIAKRTRQWDGTLEPVFFDAAGNGRTVWLDKKPPVACRVGVRVKGISEIIYATVLYAEYAQFRRDGKPTKQWADKPTVMLGKCAEAAALRKAFPQELSGLYSHEEMSHLDESDEPVERPPVVSVRPTADAPAVRLEDGDVELRFGSLIGRRVSSLSYDEVCRLVVGWNDPARFAEASARLGEDVAQVIVEHYRAQKAKIADAEPSAAEASTGAAAEPAKAAPGPEDLPVYVVRILEYEAQGRPIAPESADDLRQFLQDHPDAADAVAALRASLKGGAAR